MKKLPRLFVTKAQYDWYLIGIDRKVKFDEYDADYAMCAEPFERSTGIVLKLGETCEIEVTRVRK